jgi:hypothetical protein
MSLKQTIAITNCFWMRFAISSNSRSEELFLHGAFTSSTNNDLYSVAKATFSSQKII